MVCIQIGQSSSLSGCILQIPNSTSSKYRSKIGAKHILNSYNNSVGEQRETGTKNNNNTGTFIASQTFFLAMLNQHNTDRPQEATYKPF